MYWQVYLPLFQKVLKFSEILICLLANLYNSVNPQVTLVSLEEEMVLNLEPLVIALVHQVFVLMEFVINYIIYKCLRQHTSKLHKLKIQDVLEPIYSFMYAFWVIY